jgi:hypothetical protein
MIEKTLTIAVMLSSFLARNGVSIPVEDFNNGTSLSSEALQILANFLENWPTVLLVHVRILWNPSGGTYIQPEVLMMD